MRIAVEARSGISIVRVMEAKLTYPVLSPFFAAVRRIVAGGAREVVIDLGAVAYIDSPAIGCLLDIHRLLDARGGTLRLSSVQARVGTMLSMTGVDNILGVRRKKAEAPAPFQRDPEGWRTAGLPPELAV